MYSKKLITLLSLSLLAWLPLNAASQPLVINGAASKIDIAVKVTADSFVGKLQAYDAEIQVDPAASKVTACRVGFKWADVKTGKDKRDVKMNEWQDSAKNPDGVFQMESLEAGADGHLLAKGTLEMHGLSKPIQFPVTVTPKDGNWVIDGEATVNTTDYGLPVIKMMAMLKVDPRVVVRFHLEGAPKAAGQGS
jgi:polyisoprenoid-binding protein YceI